MAKRTMKIGQYVKLLIKKIEKIKLTEQNIFFKEKN